ncbi:LppU/SCO3897 family protein [Melissospora conviva]|uniref:LppU/SCO3897 family protein n=1 Tax=Melissospora conviva TaxID=3388432 RepID=UPI003B81135A
MSVYGSAGSGNPEDPYGQSGATPSSGSGFPPPPANPYNADPEPPTLPLHAAPPNQPGQQWGQSAPNPGAPDPNQPWGQPPAGQPAPGQPWGQPPAGQPAPGQPWGQPGSGQPAAGQPWGQPAAGQPWQQQPGTGQPGGPPGGPWAPQYGAEAPKKGNGLKITLIVVGILALLSCLGCAGLAAIGFMAEEEADPQPSVSAAASPSAEPTVSESPSPSPSATTPTTNPGDAMFAVKGDCLVNDGTSISPKLRKAACAPGTMEVLARVVGTSDKDACKDYAATEVYYTYDSPLDARDFVLCMKKR